MNLPLLSSGIDELEHAYYEQKFENRYLRSKGEAFQNFFEELMGRVHKGDFMACRPWGNVGDKKNDGFLKSEKRLFQVYAPNEMSEKKATEKINEDFEGARVHWGTYFTAWTFAHNSCDKLPPHVHELILDLEKNNPGVVIEPWGLEEFRRLFKKLNQSDLQSLFGFAPTNRTKTKLGSDDLRVVLQAISARELVSDYSPEDVPPGKIDKNGLSACIRKLISEGSGKRHMVGDFFNSWPDPTFGEKIAASFRHRYTELRDQREPRLSPDNIYNELVKWADGPERGTAEHEMAVITVLAYYFDSCDIFEPHGVKANDFAH